MSEPEIRDGNWLLMEHDIVTGRSVWMTVQDDQYIFRVDMTNDAIFDANQEAEIATMGRRFCDYNRLAYIPHQIVYLTVVNYAIEQRDVRWLARYLNNSDNRKFRTSRGSV